MKAARAGRFKLHIHRVLLRQSVRSARFTNELESYKVAH
jgi:hypothetical protein